MLDLELRRTWLALRRAGFSEQQAGDVIRVAAIEEAVQERKRALDWLSRFEQRRSKQLPSRTDTDQFLLQLEREWISFCLGIHLPREPIL